MDSEISANSDRLLTADFALTGISRLVTVAPERYGSGPLGVIANGALASQGGHIVWVGSEADLVQAVAIEAIPPQSRHDAGGRAVLPGFVDSHTHFIFAGNRAEEFQLRHTGVSYEELARQGRGILSTVRATRDAPEETLLALGRSRLESFATHGTTTVEGKTGYGLDPESEARCLRVMRELAGAFTLPTVVPTFLGAHTLPPEYRERPSDRTAYVDLICERMLPAFVADARFCDVFCEHGAFTVEESRRILERARTLGFALKLHANQLGPTGGARLAAELHAVSADHLDFATDEELDMLSGAGVVGTLLPGCSFSLSVAYPSARRLYEHGVRTALATDFNPGTSYSETMQMMIALAVSALGMTLDEAITAATCGGAAALAMETEVGSLEPGKRCDLIVLQGDDERELAYHFGVNLVARTYLRGQLFLGGTDRA
jgi:imidazolonepropionase